MVCQPSHCTALYLIMSIKVIKADVKNSKGDSRIKWQKGVISISFILCDLKLLGNMVLVSTVGFN